MAKLLPVLIGVGIAGVIIAVGQESLATVNWNPVSESSSKKKKGSKSGARTITEAAKRLSKEVVASARKWAKIRGIALTDILATIVLESRGNPQAHALTAKEDSRGAMQVNVRANKAILDRLGYKPDDLYKLDVGIEVGSLIYKNYYNKVLELVKKSPVKQWHELSTLTRLRYAGPKYVDNMLKKAETTDQTVHPFKDSHVYVAHWLEAKQAVAEALASNTYA